MHPELQKRFVKDLVRDLDGLAGRFEPFCYELMEFVAPANWSHRGTTKDGAPVGHSVDSKANNGTWVAEYGTQKGYFETGLSKVEEDIAHARKLHPQVEKLWALSNQEAPPSASTAIQQVQLREAKGGLELTVMDSRHIAEFVVDQLLDARVLAKLRDYLPSLQRLHDEWAASHRVPSYPDNVERVTIEREVLQRLEQDRHVLVTGIGGSGKSALCSSLATKLSSTFQLVLWVDAEPIRRIEALSSVDIFRNGGALNILGLMRTRPCLVILDNLVVDLDLAKALAGADPATRLLATSQSGPDSAIRLGELERDESKSILDPDGTCPSDVFERVLAAVGGHPLLLGLLGAVAREENGDWKAVLGLLSKATDLEDDTHARVCERILGRHRATLDRPFRFVALAGPHIDEALWDSVAGEPARRSFRARHFLAAAAPGIVRVHDVVATSIVQLYRDEPSSSLVKEVAGFIETQMGETQSMTLQRVVRSHFTLIESLLESGESGQAFRYAYALSRRNNMNLALLGDPVALAAALPAVAPHLSVRAIIEAVECSFTVTNARGDREAARAHLEKVLPAYEAMLTIQTLPPLLRRDLNHHRGKALDRVGRLPEAAETFSALLGVHPEFQAARLQLARVLSRIPERTEEAMAQLKAVFQFAEQRPSDLNLSVVLGAFETLTRNALRAHMLDAVVAHKTLLLASLRQGLQYGHEQPYKLLAALGLKLSYSHPELLLELAELLPNALSTPQTDQEWFAAAQIRKHAGKAMPQEREEEARALLREAATMYGQLEAPNEFMLVQAADAMLLVGRMADALVFLNRVIENQRGEFWHHRMAEVLGDQPATALQHIDLALSMGKGSFRTTYLQERFRIRRALRDEGAASDLEQAISECGDPKFKRHLEAQLEAYRASPEPLRDA